VEERLAELSLPHLPTIPELREKAEEMFQETPSLDEIVNRAHEMLAPRWPPTSAMRALASA
jgi:hypothetical protein